MRRLTALAVITLLAACAQTPPLPRLQLPALQLTPASFGGSLALAQRLTVRQLPDTARRQLPAEQSLEAQVEIEPAELRLAAFALNQRVLMLSWDGRELQVQRHLMLPAEVDAARVLRDLQFVYWPLAAVVAALPAGWSVADLGPRRTLSFDGQVRMQVDYAGLPRWQGRAELDNRLEGYRLAIESNALTER
jgi:Protein of unknown function (DUF3261)